MSQNNVKVTWKAIVAVMLVLATLVAMSVVISAGFIDTFLGEESEDMAATSSNSGSSCPGCTSEYTTHGCGKCISGVSWSPGCSTHKSKSFENICQCPVED